MTKESRDLNHLINDLAESEADIVAGRIHPAAEVIASAKETIEKLSQIDSSSPESRDGSEA